MVDPTQFSKKDLFGNAQKIQPDDDTRPITLKDVRRTFGDDDENVINLEQQRAKWEDKPTSAPPNEDDFKAWGGGDSDKLVKNMNRFYGVITVDGRSSVAHKLPDGQWEFLGLKDLAMKFANKRIMNGDKPVSIDKIWMIHFNRRDFKRIVFAPKMKEDPQILNLWSEFPIEAHQGDCSLATSYYRDLIASGNEELYNFVMDVLAHLVQKPDEKLEIAIVLVGLKGVGKTKFYEIIVRLIGALYCFQTSNPEQIYTRFNKHLINKLVLMLEEITWGGDKKHEGMLQDFITGKTFNFEVKNGPIITVQNLLRVIIDSNSPWVVPATHDERRYAVLRVSDARQKDHEYFAALDNELDHGGTEALMYQLINRDISKFNPRLAPRTEWLVDQIIEGMPDLDKWWLSVLRLGQIRKIGGDSDAHSWIIVGRRILYDQYSKALRKRSPRARILDEDDFGRQLRHLVPKIVGGKIVRELIVGKDGKTRGDRIVSLICEKRIGTDPNRMWCHVLPPLTVCRESMEFRLKRELEWNDVTEWEDAEYDSML